MTKLAEYLEQSGQTRASLAREVGVSKGYVTEICSGPKTPGLLVAVRIERATKGAVPASSWVSEK